MKKLLLVAVVSIALLYSCGEEIPGGQGTEQPDKPPAPPNLPVEIPIANTYWTAESILGGKYELTFTASTAAYIFKDSNGYTWIDECPYTYDQPAVTINVEWRDPPMHLKGNVEEDALKIELLESYETVRSVEFKKRGPKEGERPAEPTIVGEWKLTHQGTIIEEKPEMTPYNGMAKYTLRYTFKKDGTGWAYYSNEHQESFKWSRLSDKKLELDGWEVEIEGLLVDLGSHYMGKIWTVRELTSDELIVSYWMFPSSDFDENLSHYEAIMAFEKVK